MSTRSRIGYVGDDSKYYTAYCHFDGYPSYNGRVLLDAYCDIDKVKSLVNSGDFRALTGDVDCIEYYPDVEHKPTVFDTFDELLDFMNDSDQEYLYIYEDKEWVYYSIHNDNHKFTYMGLVEDYFNKDENDVQLVNQIF